jgi:hypothetical protein
MPGRAWAVIAWSGIKAMVKKRVFIGLLIFAWIPFIVRAVQIYIAANFPQATMLAPTAETFRQFIEQQGVFVFFVTIYVGAGLIANDRRANALQIYLSKPLMRIEYIAGKLAILMAFRSVTRPGILLLLQRCLSSRFLREPVPVGDHAPRVRALATFYHAGPVVARRAAVRRHSLRASSSSPAIYGACTPSPANSSLSWRPRAISQVVDVIFQGEAAVRDAVCVARRDHRAMALSISGARTARRGVEVVT